ncbi:MAG: ABC transporter ATP-binding protein [Actinomycetaceae bacterium]|nr:ABC transporter ATP-binding protein [Actinomycetaceae bacterium]
MSMTIGELISPSKKAMVVTGIMTGVAAVFSVVPYIALTEIAVRWMGGTRDRLWMWAIFAIGAALVSQFLYSIGLGLTHVAEAKLRHALRKDLVRSLGRIPLGRVDQTSSGSIRKMVVDDTASIHTIVAHLAGDATFAGVSLIGGFAYLLWVDWVFSLVLIVLWALILAVTGAIANAHATEIMNKFSAAQTRLSAAAVEMVEGIKEFKNFQAADSARTRFNDARQSFSDISYDWTNKFGRGMSITYAFLHPGSVIATVAPLAVLFVHKGWMEVGYTLPFFMIGIGIPSGLMQLVSLMQHLYEARQAAQDTAELISAEPMSEGETLSDDGPQPGSVKFDNVTFGYDADNPVIHGISFTAQAGTVTALVGPSGGGKTTLARLIARFYDPDSGTVRIGGVDVREVSFEWLLSRVAIVFQDIALAHDTVAQNIALGHENIPFEKIEEAARAACIHDRIMRLPHGYDTVIGSEGGFLSGGERQRITIARAYLHDAPILILDEATAQADPQSERAIHQALSALSVGRTVIIIAHRLATVANADQILVIEEGTLIEAGRHNELIQRGGTYAALWQAQQIESYVEEQ